jgi:hypothetical protein
MSGVTYVDGQADSRGPTGVYSWRSSRGAKIVASLPRAKPLTAQIRAHCEDTAHRQMDEAEEHIGMFEFTISMRDAE